MKDFLGQELALHDEIVYIQNNRTRTWLEKGHITGFTPKFVRYGSGWLVSPGRCIKIWPESLPLSQLGPYVE